MDDPCIVPSRPESIGEQSSVKGGGGGSAQCGNLSIFLLLRFYVELEGDPNQSFWFQMAVILKLCISDTTLVKTKCVFIEDVVFQQLLSNFWR